MSRLVPTKIIIKDQGELPLSVKDVLERDKIYFLEHKHALVYKRECHPEEAYPYALPIDRTYVMVSRNARQFIVDGVPTLLIIENEQPSQKKKARAHQQIQYSKKRGPNGPTSERKD